LHKDSMGNKEVLKRGAVQFTTAGTGIRHSEFNADERELVHFIQIWVKPNKKGLFVCSHAFDSTVCVFVSGLKPSYQTKSFENSEKEGKLRLIVAPVDSKDKDKDASAISINQDVRMYATLLKNGQTVSLDVAPGRDVYVHVIQDATGNLSLACLLACF